MNGVGVDAYDPAAAEISRLKAEMLLPLATKVFRVEDVLPMILQVSEVSRV